MLLEEKPTMGHMRANKNDEWENMKLLLNNCVCNEQSDWSKNLSCSYIFMT